MNMAQAACLSTQTEATLSITATWEAVWNGGKEGLHLAEDPGGQHDPLAGMPEEAAKIPHATGVV
jgi:hypothetical protein